MEKFKFEMIVEKNIIVEANSFEEAQEIAKKKFIDSINQHDVRVVSYRNETDWQNILSECRKEVIECIDNNIEGLAESHVECWESRYFGKSKEDIIFDLDVNHDISLEVDNIEYELGFSLNSSEYKYLCEIFKETVSEVVFNM